MRRILLAAVLCAALSQAARADDAPSPADEAAIRDVISQQIDAFRTENGAAAEAFAAPGIKEKFPNPDSFMGMVRTGYPALIRPRATHFEDLRQTALGLVQTVTVVDGSGQVWTAAYTMTKVDGQWRISGCYMLKSEAVST
jgi:hypothetical protein